MIQQKITCHAIGLTIVVLDKIEGNKIYFSGADMIDGTPLLDIKPYSPDIDLYPDAANGWPLDYGTCPQRLAQGHAFAHEAGRISGYHGVMPVTTS